MRNPGLFIMGVGLALCTVCAEIEASAIATNDAPLFNFDAINLASENLDLSRLDLYVKIHYDELQFTKQEDGFHAKYEIIVAILDESGKPVDVKDLREEIATQDVSDIKSTRKFKLSQLSFDLPPAKYEMALSLQDLETQGLTNHKQEIALRDYHGPDLTASDVLLLDHLSQDPEGNYTFTPKVSGQKLGDSRLFAYFEVYNVPESDSVYVRSEIFNPKDGKVVDSESKEVWVKSKGRVTKNYLEIASSSLPHGSYAARLKVEHNKKEALSLERAFDWFWEGLPSSFASLDEAIDALSYIAGKDEIEKIKKTPGDQKHVAYLKFWEKRDPTPGTSDNEYRNEYYNRIKVANETFFGYRKPGWKTDMGWVYVKLGPADSIERNAFNQNFAHLQGRTVKSYEIWNYYRFSRNFLFVDENGFGEYRLDNPDELYDIIDRNVFKNHR